MSRTTSRKTFAQMHVSDRVFYSIFGHYRTSETPEPNNIKEIIDNSLSELSETERNVFLMRIVNLSPFCEIGEKTKLSTERARQIYVKVLKKFRHPRISGAIMSGIVPDKMHEIEYAELSRRAYNCLKRSNMKSRDDVESYCKRYIGTPLEALMQIRNCGEATAKEILEKLDIQ